MSPPVDIGLNGGGSVSIKDANSNATMTIFDMDVPHMIVALEKNEVLGYSFQLGDLVTLTVDDPKTTLHPDFQKTVVTKYSDTKISVGPSLSLKTGDIIEMSDSLSTRKLVVWDLFITSADQERDLVYGFTSLPMLVNIQTIGPLWVERNAVPDASGNWMADFGDPAADPYGDGTTADIQPGSVIYLIQYDDDFDGLENSWTVPTVLDIKIDIKPGSNTNPINLGAKGVIPVAVLTTPGFNATTINPATVLFAGAKPSKWSKKDVDYDGDMDLLFHFDIRKLQLTRSSIEASLTGNTFDGRQVQGTDKVRIVPVVSYP